MPKISLNANIQISSGPRLVIAYTVDVNAYDVIEATIRPHDFQQQFELQPTEAPEKVKLILIVSDQYSSAVRYSVDSLSGKSFVLDGPLVLFGGATGLIGHIPRMVTFSSATDREVRVQIIIGRHP